MNIITGHKGLYQPLIYAQHTEKKKKIQTQSLQHHKLRQINLIKQSCKVIRRLNHEIR